MEHLTLVEYDAFPLRTQENVLNEQQTLSNQRLHGWQCQQEEI